MIEVIGRPASLWDLPVEAKCKSVCQDQTPLLLLGSTWLADPQFCIVAFHECVIVVIEAHHADPAMWACTRLKNLGFDTLG